MTSTRSVKDLSQSELIKKKPLFRYFLDGSRRTYKVDDLRYGKRLYPAVAGQIGIACCERKSKDIFEPYEFDRSIVISIPERANSGSHKTEFFFNSLLKKLNDEDYLKKGIFSLVKFYITQTETETITRKKLLLLFKMK